MLTKKKPDLIHANFFFTDIVGLSNPKMSTTTQFKKLSILNDALKECKSYKETLQQDMIQFPTGDGMCIGFLKDQNAPMSIAIELSEKLFKYNKGRIPSEIIQIRIGLHAGNCFIFTDIQKRSNVWGPGIIVAKRIMDIGDAGHILMSDRFAQDLIELSDKYRAIVHPVQDYSFKHGLSMLVYSAFGKNFGNKRPPSPTGNSKTRETAEQMKLQNSALYSSVFVSLSITEPKEMTVHHKRTYTIQNVSNKPIKYVSHGIGTDVEKLDISDLNIKTFDDSKNQMSISSININESFCKEFSTVFTKPIKKNQIRHYTLEYDVEEPKRFYENNFSLDCKELILEFSYPKTSKIKNPSLFDFNIETEEKTPSTLVPKISKQKQKTTYLWKIIDVVKGQTIRLEW